MYCRLFTAAIAAMLLHLPCLADDKPKTEQKRPITIKDIDQRMNDLENQLAGITKELGAIRKDLKSLAQASPSGSDLKVFPLKHTDAATTAALLQDLLQGPGARRLKLTADPHTNCLLVAGNDKDLAIVEAILSRLDMPAKAEKKELSPTPKPNSIDIEALKERLAWSKRMHAKGYLPAGEVADLARQLEKLGSRAK